MDFFFIFKLQKNVHASVERIKYSAYSILATLQLPWVQIQGEAEKKKYHKIVSFSFFFPDNLHSQAVMVRMKQSEKAENINKRPFNG